MFNYTSNAKRILAAALIAVFTMVSVLAGSQSVFAASKLKVTPAKKTIYVGKAVTLKANKNAKWSVAKGKKFIKLTSKKKKIVKVKGLKPGTAYVKVKAGKKTTRVKITVKAPAPKKFVLTPSRKMIGVGETGKVSIGSVSPSAASKDVTYSSSDKTVATVSNKGVVTGVSAGKVKITAKSKLNKKVSASVELMIVDVKDGVVTVNIDMTDAERYPAGKVAKVWIPVPVTNDNQDITNEVLTAPAATDSRYTTDSAGNKTLYIEWGEAVEPADRTATLTFHVRRRAVDRPDDLAKMEKGTVDKKEFAEYLKETSMSGSQTEGIVKETADAIMKESGAVTVYDKAHAIYNWVTNNLYRNGKSEHRLSGDVVGILTSDRVCGTCVDVNAVFVALCRIEGIPARETIGLRLTPTGQKCKAQFYLPGYGWVEADPSQPLKVILGEEDKYRGENATKEDADYWQVVQETYWGYADENWIMVTDGRDITLDPAQSGVVTENDGVINSDGTLGVFMFPYGEFDGQVLLSTDDENFKHTYTFVED